MEKEIVIAAYDKQLDWLNTINEDVKKTIYRKGEALELKDYEGNYNALNFYNRLFT